MPLGHAQDHAALADRKAQVPQPGPLPRRPHGFSYRRRPFPKTLQMSLREAEASQTPNPLFFYSLECVEKLFGKAKGVGR